jgi:hypothetical protein
MLIRSARSCNARTLAKLDEWLIGQWEPVGRGDLARISWACKLADMLGAWLHERLEPAWILVVGRVGYPSRPSPPVGMRRKRVPPMSVLETARLGPTANVWFGQSRCDAC